MVLSKQCTIRSVCNGRGIIACRLGNISSGRCGESDPASVRLIWKVKVIWRGIDNRNWTRKGLDELLENGELNCHALAVYYTYERF